MSFTPLEDKVLIEPLEPPGKSAGGIYLPDSAKKKTERGLVVGMGRGRMDLTGGFHLPECRPGDVVVFDPYAATELVDEGGKKFLLLSQDAILAIVRENK